MKKFKFKYILDIPKTIYFNFKTLPLKDAIKLPFYISHKYKLLLPKNSKNIFVFETPIKRFNVRFANGGSSDIIPNKYGLIQIKSGAKIYLKDDIQFSAGCALRVQGELKLGGHFSANRNCSISCVKSIMFGDDCLLAFEVFIRDSDGHKIINDSKEKLSVEQVFIGNHVWICGKTSILKGAFIPNNSVIGYGSIVTKKFLDSNTLLAGIPAKIINNKINWVF